MSKRTYKLSNYITPIFETPSESSEWFGYYNYDVLNQNQSLLLCNRAPYDGKAPVKGAKIELGSYDIHNGQWHHIGESDSWNWQQGSMLQWVPNRNNQVIYNCSKNGRIISCIHNLTTNINKELDFPIYGITPDGKKSISIDLERSYWCRAYHYQSVANPEREGRVYEDDGIFEIDLEKNTRKKIISIQEIIATDKRSYFAQCKHWVEHVMISPSGKKICFLHRFSPEGNVLNYKTRPFIADINGSNLQVIPDWDSYSWSHWGWKSDDEFVIYAIKTSISDEDFLRPAQLSSNKNISHSAKQKAIQLIRSYIPQSFIDKMRSQVKSYRFYECKEGHIALKENCAMPIFGIDGHPSFTADGRYMITDSYPDNKGFQRLIIYDTITQKGIIVGKFFATYWNNPASCDLHPKLCRNNDFLAVDTAYDKKHHTMVFLIDWEQIKRKISL
ncbi:MAG: hypothetical protein IJV08_01145 [Bacteroidaceae bacterium]|nr:hypothetical protein [Bacteroidaceae bacterium]